MSSKKQIVLELKDIKKSFQSGKRWLKILNGVDLKVHAGERVAIVGQSGSGKSTLLQIAGLLDKPSEGKVQFREANVGDASDNTKAELRREQFGFVYQFHHLLPEFTALENVLMPARLGNQMGMHEAVGRARELLIDLGLAERINHYPAHLSGGEQQRVAIARALMNKPSILFADEPTGNLDPATADSVFSLFQKLAGQHKLAVVMVTHNQELAKSCDSIYRMQEGHLVKA